MNRIILPLILGLALTACGQEPADAPTETEATVAASAAPEVPIETDTATPVEADTASSLPAEAPPQDVVVAEPPPPATAAVEQSCEDEVGAAAAARLVAVCINVSPATRPPCNAQNSCDLIESEIKRSCDMLGEDAPPECAVADEPR